jgi:FMN phosphatase YigB (HAD superfamily)
MKEYHRDRIHAEVFDNDPRMIQFYADAEARERKPSEGLKEALEFLRERGKTTSIVSEVSSVPGTLTIIAFLRAHQFVHLFDEVITPAGRFTTEGTLLDEKTFKGANKKDGTIFERLSSYLDSKGVSAGRRAMVGDDPKQDVELAKKYGFVTVQFCGIIDRGRTGHADSVIMSWKELAKLH